MTSKTIYSTPMCSCIICKKEYSASGIYTHSIRSHGTSEQKSKYKSGFTVSDRQTKSDKISARINQEIEEYNQNPNFCSHCNQELHFKSRNLTYCSHSCAAKSTNKNRCLPSEILKSSISDGVKNFHKQRKLDFIGPPKPVKNIKKTKIIPEFIGVYSPVSFGTCKKCKNYFLKTEENKFKSTCKVCKIKTKTLYVDFRFNFNLFDYPDLFDLKLISTIGFYAPRGKSGKWNPNGLSRDHKISVSDAIKNNYDPFYITHPLNCELMPHQKNNKKKSKSSITYSELVKLVDEYVKW